MDRQTQTETGQKRNVGYENQLLVAIISLNYLEVEISSTSTNFVKEGEYT